MTEKHNIEKTILAKYNNHTGNEVIDDFKKQPKSYPYKFSQFIDGTDDREKIVLWIQTPTRENCVFEWFFGENKPRIIPTERHPVYLEADNLWH